MKILPVSQKSSGIRIENIPIPGPDSRTRLRLRCYRPPSGTRLAGLLWLHGGGYIAGRPEMDDPACLHFAREAGIAVVSVDYRTAPENPFPCALEDSYTALKWAAAQVVQLGIDPGRLAVGGASAGGGLAAALAQAAHDRAEIRLGFQLLVYPMLDDRSLSLPGLDSRAYLGWDPASNRFGWQAYLGKHLGATRLPDYAVPARRENLAGLPPAWIGVGSLDLFHNEDLAYGQRLRECGVACETITIPGAFHGFDLVGPQLPVVRDFRASQIAAMLRHL